MLLHIEQVLNAEELRHAQALVGPPALWVDGRRSAGPQAQHAKQNQQLAQGSPALETMQALVLAALQRHPLFFSAALPKKIFNPQVNRYSGTHNFYGNHVDGAVLHSATGGPDGAGQRVRSDLSATLFLAQPEAYEGGELVIEDSLGPRRVKLPAGDLVLYPSSSVHRVEPVTRGHRVASFFWVESMVRSDEQRRLLFDLDMSLVRLRERHGESPDSVRLTGTYHNLLRMWADT
jgi:PKHD-type hydroxylase